MRRKQLFNLLKVLISIGLLIFIFSSLDLQAFFEAVGQANPWWLLAALITMMIGVVIRAYRWQILLDAIGVFVPLLELTNIYFIGFLFNNLLPSGLGGDAIRMVELRRYSERTSDAVTSVVVDRFLGLSALQAIALMALLPNWDAVPPAVAYFTVAIFLGGLVMGYLLINRALYLKLRASLGLFRRLTDIKWVGSLAESFQRYPLSALGRAYLVSFLFNISLVAMNVFIGLGLGAQVSLAQYAIFVPITSIILLLPISFAGLGVREETYRQLFTQAGVSQEIAVAMSLLVYAIGNICTGLIGGVIYLLRGARGVVSEKG
jgi:uncharacterized protein (TIRG00374 family)